MKILGSTALCCGFDWYPPRYHQELAALQILHLIAIIAIQDILKVSLGGYCLAGPPRRFVHGILSVAIMVYRLRLGFALCHPPSGIPKSLVSWRQSGVLRCKHRVLELALIPFLARVASSTTSRRRCSRCGLSTPFSLALFIQLALVLLAVGL